MMKRKVFLMVLAAVMILPFVFLFACGGNNDDGNDTEPLPEGYYRITAQKTTGGQVVVSKKSAQEGEEITLSYSADNGYLFVSYAVKTDDNESVDISGDSFTMPAKNVVVSGTFERISNQSYDVVILPSNNYVIEIVSPSQDEALGDVFRIKAGTRISLNVEVFDDTYEFVSWNIVDRNGNLITVSGNSFVMPNSAVTISAIVDLKTCSFSIDAETLRVMNVTVKDEDDRTVENNEKVKYNTRLTFSYEFKTEGYEFLGWTDQNGRTVYPSTLIQGDLILSARFNPLQHSLRVDDRWNEENSWGGKSLYLTNKDGERIDRLVNAGDRNKARTDEEITIHCETLNRNFAVDYYVLKYSDDGSSFSERVDTNKFNMLPYNVTVSVKLKIVENSYGINYVLDGGEPANDSPTEFNATDESLTIPNSTRELYKFCGWEEEDDWTYSRTQDENSITFLYPYQIDSDLTCTARWAKVATITYDYSAYTGYDLDGYMGKYVEDNNPTTYIAGEYIELNDPIYAYGNFEGWYTSPTFEEESKIVAIYVEEGYGEENGKEEYGEEDNDVVDLTLYAKMGLKNFHINFVKIGVSSSGTKVLANSAYLDWFNLSEEPRDLTRDMYNEKTYTVGYTFAGFYTDADLTTPITEVSNELDHGIVVYAKETLDTYTITYSTYEGEVDQQDWTYSYTVETERIGLRNWSNYDNVYGHWIFRGWRLNNAYTGELFRIYVDSDPAPSADPETYHGDLVFYAYYEKA